MTSRLALAAILAFGAASAQADPRITTRLYQPTDVVVVQGKAGIESTIAFADDEHIENVAVGNSAVWQVTPNKRANLLFVKPAGPRARTNMTVVTDQHTYLFDLVSGMATPVYMLRFTYPLVPKKVEVAAAPPPASAPVAIATSVPAEAEATPPPSPAELRFAWVTAGDRKLLPERVFDDGHAVFLAWRPDAALPAILTRGPTGQEGPVNFTVKGDTIVVDGVPAQIVLRSGKQMATLTPEAARTATPAPPAAPHATVALADTGSPRP